MPWRDLGRNGVVDVRDGLGPPLPCTGRLENGDLIVLRIENIEASTQARNLRWSGDKLASRFDHTIENRREVTDTKRVTVPPLCAFNLRPRADKRAAHSKVNSDHGAVISAHFGFKSSLFNGTK